MLRYNSGSIRQITNYGIYRHDVKVEHPPRQQPKNWRLPVHRKLVYVSQGWFYRKQDGVSIKTVTSCVSLVKSSSQKLLETFTKEEFTFLIDNKEVILREFDREAKLRPLLEADDLKREHVCH